MKLKLIIALVALTTITNAQTWLWSETPGDTASANFVAMCTDATGNCYATGYFNGTVTFGSLPSMTAPGTSSVFVVKFDNNGKPLWDAQTTGNSFDQSMGIALDASGNVYITGYFESSTLSFGSVNLTNLGTMNIFVAKYNTSGALQWAERFGDNSTTFQMGNAIAADPAGNVYVTGYFHGNFVVPPLPSPAATGLSGEFDMFLMKLNTNGAGIWARRTACAFAKSTSGYTDGTSIALNNNGVLCVGGQFEGDTCFYETDTLRNNSVPGGSSDAFLAEYDTSGKFINKAVHISSYGYDDVVGLSADKSGNFYATGSYGEILYFPNFTISYSGKHGPYNVWLLKMKANGVLAWGNRIGNSSYGQTPLGLFVDTNTTKGDFYTWGYYQGECDFDSIVLPDSAGAYGMYLAKYDSAGAAQSELTPQRDTKASRSVIGAGVDKSDNLYVTGTFSDSLRFGTLPGIGTPRATVTSEFLSKYGNVPTAIPSINAGEGNVKVYPNPTKGITIFQLESRNQNTKIEVYNVLGEIVYQSSFSAPRYKLDLSGQPAGVYFYKVIDIDNKQVANGKLILQE